jgi:hypothetical protein
MSDTFKIIISLIICFFCYSKLEAQSAFISGKISNDSGEPIAGVSISITNTNIGIISKSDGSFMLRIPANTLVRFECSFVSYYSVSDSVFAKTNEKIDRNYTLYEKPNELEEVIVEGVKERENTLTRVNMRSLEQLPNASGNIETLLKTFSTVISNNELSSQYSVRGGNYDENLIYVNDIEIFRPMLVQQAQQEGLSFVNPDMVASLQFSAGGFETQYGDKMSSVLDIRYKKPTKYEGSASASLLGTTLHLAGVSKNKKLSINTGLRYKTSQYLLSSLETKGEYLPRFLDIQTNVSYDINSKSSISFLGNLSTNRFTMIPTNRTTNFGTISQTLSFDVFYEGQEKDKFDTYLGAISYNYTPSPNVLLKFIASAFSSNEEIAQDILSEYYINQATGKGTDHDTVFNIGTGAALDHIRDFSDSKIFSLEHKGSLIYGQKSVMKWGIKAQSEDINLSLNEWSVIDSIGYFIPYSVDEIVMDYYFKAHHLISSIRYQAYVQNSNRLYTQNAEYEFNYGIRANYSNLNHEIVVSPRAMVNVKPYWKKDISFFIATGIYDQPPFYKELLNYDGVLYPNTKAQKSFQIVAGTDIHYKAWDRPFTFTTEIYYKDLYKLIPYKVEDIQIKYMPTLEAKGYAAGVDFRINGEFVPGTESWFSLSLMQTHEDTRNDVIVSKSGKVYYPGYYRRPTDQTITFSIFFQDYLPSNPDFKMHMLLNYGSGLPYSGPTQNRPSEVYTLGQYRRVDIGVSRIIKREKHKAVGLNDIWITFEVLNLLDAKNMPSYDWVKTVDNNEGFRTQYAVPNYLTGRRFNFKISTKL